VDISTADWSQMHRNQSPFDRLPLNVLRFKEYSGSDEHSSNGEHSSKEEKKGQTRLCNR